MRARIRAFESSAYCASSGRLARAWWPILICLLASISGCRTHLSLRDNTLRTAGTLTDLNYQQVLDNLARFHDNPAAMPSFAGPGESVPPPAIVVMLPFASTQRTRALPRSAM